MSNLSEFGNTVHYLEFYYHCAGPSLSDTFDHEFWSRITLQMAHAEPAVRHALIAVAYLNRQQTGSLKHAACSNFADRHQDKHLLLHYNKALRLLVTRMMEPFLLTRSRAGHLPTVRLHRISTSRSPYCIHAPEKRSQDYSRPTATERFAKTNPLG